MRTGAGFISEVQVDEAGHYAAWIRCGQEIQPAPGQYVLARDPQDKKTVLARPLYAGEYRPGSFLALDPEAIWQPGVQLELRGPLGVGFQLPEQARRVALVALEGQPGRLMPLVGTALAKGAAVVLYCDPLPRRLPVSLEAFPLAALPEALPWADYLAADTPLVSLGEMGALLGLRSRVNPSMAGHSRAGYSRAGSPWAGYSQAGQVLVRTDMPCAGIADCGICAVPTRGGWKLACEDGPVFDLQALDWQAVIE